MENENTKNLEVEQIENQEIEEQIQTVISDDSNESENIKFEPEKKKGRGRPKGSFKKKTEDNGRETIFPDNGETEENKLDSKLDSENKENVDDVNKIFNDEFEAFKNDFDKIESSTDYNAIKKENRGRKPKAAKAKTDENLKISAATIIIMLDFIMPSVALFIYKFVDENAAKIKTDKIKLTASQKKELEPSVMFIADWLTAYLPAPVQFFLMLSIFYISNIKQELMMNDLKAK